MKAQEGDANKGQWCELPSPPCLGVPLASWVRHASFLTPARMPSSARMGAAARPCFPPSQVPPALPLP